MLYVTITLLNAGLLLDVHSADVVSRCVIRHSTVKSVIVVSYVFNVSYVRGKIRVLTYFTM